MKSQLHQVIHRKRFWAAVASVVAIVGNSWLGLNEEELRLLVFTIGSLIVGDSIRPLAPKD